MSAEFHHCVAGEFLYPTRSSGTTSRARSDYRVLSLSPTPSLKKEAGRSPPSSPHRAWGGDSLVPRAGLLHAVGSSRRCGVQIDLYPGDLPIPERPHVCLVIDKSAAGVANRCLGVHRGHHLVVLGDELSWLERREVESRCETPKPAQDGFLAFKRSGVRVVGRIAWIHPLDVVRHHLGKRRHVAPTESLIRTLGEAGVLIC